METLSDSQGSLKKDQVAQAQAKNWKENLSGERTFNLQVSKIILQKKTYEILSKENQNRLRVKLGLELVDGIYEICAFAFSSVFEEDCTGGFLDNQLPVFKLSPENQDYSVKIAEVEAAVSLWKGWRDGEIGDGENAPVRKYIYPISYLLTKSELNEIFNVEAKDAAQIGFGIVKTMTAMVFAGVKDTRTFENEEDEVFDFTQFCPPIC